jgi:hypothetical protein
MAFYEYLIDLIVSNNRRRPSELGWAKALPLFLDIGQEFRVEPGISRPTRGGFFGNM